MSNVVPRWQPHYMTHFAPSTSPVWKQTPCTQPAPRNDRATAASGLVNLRGSPAPPDKIPALDNSSNSRNKGNRQRSQRSETSAFQRSSVLARRKLGILPSSHDHHTSIGHLQ
ncbi:uncharacterized protein PHACADRAFT_246122 [Phanerochaete carnosa HHB-10118-sp]|uniref:Uncharacterized protein n=1 Tax=Phanerochaete carnosa (strain HHB-10118-sp) TaxID=650164 RepID=K5VBH9_PHACS|nr:uncharacterized protein PHACADRAFT_246122 [Phanerochaete carnosa HHB-10118-sp]EKM60256.1 hypothetical protein PHACADRAFT_246122 [Phanerochaete carnosa HHB-10118-sp]